MRRRAHRPWRHRAASSHILSEVERLATRVTILREERRVETGTLTEPRHMRRKPKPCRAQRGASGTVPVDRCLGRLAAQGASEFFAVAFLESSELDDVWILPGSRGADQRGCAHDRYGLQLQDSHGSAEDIPALVRRAHSSNRPEGPDWVLVRHLLHRDNCVFTASDAALPIPACGAQWHPLRG